MNTIVNVKIDIAEPNGLKLIRELYGQKGVEIENSEICEKTYPVKEVFDELKESLKEHYGIEE